MNSASNMIAKWKVAFFHHPPYHFMLIEIVGDVMHFQVVNEIGKTVDSGAINRPDVATAPGGAN